jgi:uncharacterized protein
MPINPIGPHLLPQRIAVIGSGIAGLGAAWLLRQRHHVTLFEADTRAGGHANTIDVTLDGLSHPVDTGFLVYNDWTYPNLIGMFKHLGVETALSDMSFSVSLDDGGFEWAGSNRLATTFAQPTNVFKPAFWSMLADLIRFNREASRLVASGAAMPGSLGDYLDRHGYGRAFRQRYLVPMAACIWSTPSQLIDEFPLATFLTFCRNHGLISINERPQWRTVKNGSRCYVERLLRDLQDVRLGCPVTRVERHAAGVTLSTGAGPAHFDQVILACHTDQALAMLAHPTAAEQSMLGGIHYQPNVAVLHSDPRQMPRRKAAWAAWNFKGLAGAATDQPVSLTYWLNRLQPLPFTSPVMVTMNPLTPPDPAKVIQTIEYSHPVYRADSVATQSTLPEIQGRNHTWFAGAWTRFGFHEDGLLSAVSVARALGAEIPWEPATTAGQPTPAVPLAEAA